MAMASKKVVAALAGVNQYLLEEAEAAERARVAASQIRTVSLWAMSGRERIMRNRELLAARLWR